MELQKLLFALTLFDGGEGAAADESGSAMVESTPVNDQQELGGVGKTDRLGSDAEAEENAAEDKKTLFRKMIEGEYREEYQTQFKQDFQTAFDRRHKNVRQTQEQLNKANEIIDLLRIKYKGATDADSIKAALENDNGFWDEAAEESGTGMTGEQYRTLEQLRRDKESRDRADAMRMQVANWNREAQTVKTMYPDFDLNAEIQDNGFKGMLRAGIPMQHAYEVRHLGEIKSTAAKAAAEEAERKVVEGIRAKGSRPAENGVSSKSGVITEKDVSKLTREQRADIAKRVARGETIRL